MNPLTEAKFISNGACACMPPVSMESPGVQLWQKTDFLHIDVEIYIYKTETEIEYWNTPRLDQAL